MACQIHNGLFKQQLEKFCRFLFKILINSFFPWNKKFSKSLSFRETWKQTVYSIYSIRGKIRSTFRNRLWIRPVVLFFGGGGNKEKAIDVILSESIEVSFFSSCCINLLVALLKKDNSLILLKQWNNKLIYVKPHVTFKFLCKNVYDNYFWNSVNYNSILHSYAVYYKLVDIQIFTSFTQQFTLQKIT